MQVAQALRQAKGRKYGLWLLGPGLLVIVGLVAIAVFGVAVSTVLLFGVALLCPLLHVFMMGKHGHGGTEHAEHHQQQPPTRPAGS